MLNPIPKVINGLTQMSQALNPAEAAWLDWLRQDDEAKQADYQTYREYFNGIHNVPLTDRQKQYLGLRGVDFRFNFLRLPVKTMTQRLNVVGFESPDKALVGSEGVLWQWWQANRMDAVQRGTHQATAVDGDTYVLVEWDAEKQRPKFSHVPAYDGKEGMKVVYSDANRRVPAFASYRWRYTDPATGNTRRHLNVYTADATYKFKSHSTDAWTRRIDDEDMGIWPLPWADGVPVFHNRHDDDGSNWGRSELEDTIPIQQALNKAVIDLIEGADKTAYQLITLTGGKASNVKVDPRQVLSHQDPAANWGYIPAGDIHRLIDMKNDFIVSIAQTSQVPLSYFQVTGQVASAETQQADDTGLVSKVEDNAVAYGNFWEDVMSMAVKLSNRFAGTSYNPEMISTKWASFERVDKQASERTQAETAEINARTFDTLLLSNPRGDRYKLALLAGYDEDDAQVLAESDGRIDGSITQ